TPITQRRLPHRPPGSVRAHRCDRVARLRPSRGWRHSLERTSAAPVGNRRWPSGFGRNTCPASLIDPFLETGISSIMLRGFTGSAHYRVASRHFIGDDAPATCTESLPWMLNSCTWSTDVRLFQSPLFTDTIFPT